MRVLWFTNVAMPGFLQQKGLQSNNVGGWMASLLNALRQYAPNIEIGVAFAGRDVECVSVEGVKYYSLGLMHWRRNRYKVSSSFRRVLIDAVEDFAPDVIHIHGTEGVAVAFSDLQFSEIPLIVSLQGILTGYYPHLQGGLSNAELRPYFSLYEYLRKDDMTSMGIRWRTVNSPIEKLLLNKAAGILGRTDWDRAWANMLAPNVKYWHVGEIMRDCFYGGARNNNDVIPHTIFCSAALSYPLKGGHWLLRAVANLKRKYPDVQVRVADAARVNAIGFVAKLKSTQYHKYIRSLISNIGVASNVILLPNLDQAEVRRELEKAEIFCLPSLCENSPNSLGEAILTGVPSVVTDVGGCSSIIRDNIDGYLVPPADPAILASRIDELFSDRMKARRFAVSALERNKKFYDHKTIVDQLINAYESVRQAFKIRRTVTIEVGGER